MASNVCGFAVSPAPATSSISPQSCRTSKHSPFESSVRHPSDAAHHLLSHKDRVSPFEITVAILHLKHRMARRGSHLRRALKKSLLFRQHRPQERHWMLSSVAVAKVPPLAFDS